MLLKKGVVPIINENDVTSVDELRRIESYKVSFSDNDILSVLVASAINASMIIILSDINGLYTADPHEPRAALIKTVEAITPELKSSLNGKNKLGRGGIQSKIKAAEIATSCGIPVVIANSRRENVLLDALAGKDVGTFFKPQNSMSAVRRWIAYGATVKGQIHVNKDAKKAILGGASLLPIGITRVVGNFNVGDVVSIVDENKVEFAKGNPKYDSGELSLIKGLQMADAQRKLGFDRPREVLEHKNIHLIEEERC
jgi:glutamate 5-kinase